MGDLATLEGLGVSRMGTGTVPSRIKPPETTEQPLTQARLAQELGAHGDQNVSQAIPVIPP